MKKIINLFQIIALLSTTMKSQDLISNVVDGALLVRLQTNQNAINYHVRNNNLKEAAEYKKQQKMKNTEIMENFAAEWTLGPVYFFYSTYSNEISKNNFNNVFKNNNQTLSKSEKEKLKNNFLIAYIGKTTGTLKFHSLILVDQNFKPLKRPLPRYVRTYKGLWILKRKLRNSIRILEKKIKFHVSRIQ